MRGNVREAAEKGGGGCMGLFLRFDEIMSGSWKFPVLQAIERRLESLDQFMHGVLLTLSAPCDL